jgi:tripartite ATP-independent transporter DctM subunit
MVELYRIATNPTLVAIPLFTFAGYVLAESRTSVRLINLSRAWFGFVPGGLSIVVLLTCAVFTAFTGASGVTIVALGGLLFPILMKEHYSEKFSLGLITTSGSLGLLFPPSLPLILYALVAKLSIDQLFVAGIWQSSASTGSGRGGGSTRPGPHSSGQMSGQRFVRHYGKSRFRSL